MSHVMVGIVIVALSCVSQVIAQSEEVVLVTSHAYSASEFCEHFNNISCYAFGNFNILLRNQKEDQIDVHSLCSEYRCNVQYIENNIQFKIYDSDECQAQPLNSPGLWGLARINQHESVTLNSSKTYSFDFSTHDNGQDVTVFILDTGINVNHTEFGNRSYLGYVSPQILDFEGPEDLNGHGTNVAGLVGSFAFGAAKETTLIGVKSMDQGGFGNLRDLIGGFNYIYNVSNCDDPSEQSIVGVLNLSLGTDDESDIFHEIIKKLVECGITIIAAAGNDDDGACYYFPGSYTEVINVGATTETDFLAEFSNWGSCVDILAPGTNLLTTSIGSENATEVVQRGTSFSAPLVTGIVARMKSREPYLKPEEVLEKLLEVSTVGKIAMVPSYKESTPNKLAFTECTLDVIITTTLKLETTTPTREEERNTTGTTSVPKTTTVSSDDGLSALEITLICVVFAAALVGLTGSIICYYVKTRSTMIHPADVCVVN